MTSTSLFFTAVNGGSSCFKDAFTLACDQPKESLIKAIFGYAHGINRVAKSLKLFHDHEKNENDETLATLVKFLCNNAGCNDIVIYNSSCKSLDDFKRKIDLDVSVDLSKSAETILGELFLNKSSEDLTDVFKYANPLVKSTKYSKELKDLIVKSVMYIMKTNSNETITNVELEQDDHVKGDQVEKDDLPYVSVPVSGLYVTLDGDMDDETNMEPLLEHNVLSQELIIRFKTSWMAATKMLEVVEDEQVDIIPTVLATKTNLVAKAPMAPEEPPAKVQPELSYDSKSLSQTATTGFFDLGGIGKGKSNSTKLSLPPKKEDQNEDDYLNTLELKQEVDYKWESKTAAERQSLKKEEFRKMTKEVREKRMKSYGLSDNDKNSTIKNTKKRTSFGDVTIVDKSYFAGYADKIKPTNNKAFYTTEDTVVIPMKISNKIAHIPLIVDEIKEQIGLQSCKYRVIECDKTPVYDSTEKDKKEITDSKIRPKSFFLQDKYCFLVEATAFKYSECVCLDDTSIGDFYLDGNMDKGHFFANEMYNIYMMSELLGLVENYKSVVFANNKFYLLGEGLPGGKPSTLRKMLNEVYPSNKDYSVVKTNKGTLAEDFNKLVPKLKGAIKRHLQTKDDSIKSYVFEVMQNVERKCKIWEALGFDE